MQNNIPCKQVNFMSKFVRVNFQNESHGGFIFWNSRRSLTKPAEQCGLCQDMQILIFGGKEGCFGKRGYFAHSVARNVPFVRIRPLSAKSLFARDLGFHNVSRCTKNFSFLLFRRKKKESAKDVKSHRVREGRCSASAPTCDTFMPLAA